MVTLNNEQASLVATFLRAIKFNFKRYTGMNTGHSAVHNIWPNELRIIDEITELIGDNVK